MDAPCACACDCSCVYVYFKLILPAHDVSIVLQGFIPTTAGPRLNFNQLLSAITAMVWISMKLIPRAHTWTIQAAAGLSSVLARRQEQVTCGCGGEQRHSCQTEMTAALPPQHRVHGMRGNEARRKMWTLEEERKKGGTAWCPTWSRINKSHFFTAGT